MQESETTQYGKTGMIRAKEGSVDELVAILLQAAELVSSLEGCRLYVVGKDRGDDKIIWVTEIWDNQEDHARSLQLEAIRELISKAMPLIESFPEGGAETDILGGWGIDK